MRKEIPTLTSAPDGPIAEALTQSGLATSNTEARRLIGENAVSINGTKISRDHFAASDFLGGRLLLRKGKRFKDSALVEL
jgi:tyrosyl-tRNA synthetase